MIKVNKRDKEKANKRALKKADFITRYSNAFGITEKWTFIIFDNASESKTRARMWVELVKYLLNDRAKKRIKDLLCDLKKEPLTTPAFLKTLSIKTALSPIRAGIIANEPGQGYYITDPTKAKLWLELMQEMIQRDW